MGPRDSFLFLRSCIGLSSHSPYFLHEVVAIILHKYENLLPYDHTDCRKRSRWANDWLLVDNAITPKCM